MSERTNPRGNPAPQSDPVTESPSMKNVYAPPEYFARQRHPAEEKLLTTNAYAPPEYFTEPQSDPWEEERRMTEVYAPPELMRPAMDARQNPSAQRLYPQRYEENRPDPDPRVSDGEPCFAPVYAAPPVPGPNGPRRTPVPAAPSPSRLKKGLLERLFGRRKKP